MAHSQFLERDPSKRLACKPGGEDFEEVKRHPWFQNINWETLETKEQIAPFIPDVRLLLLAIPSCVDRVVIQSKKANFDASHELEELLLEDNPLRARQRKERDISSLSAEMRQMEEQYVMVIQAGFFYQSTLSLLTITYPSQYI